MSARNNVGVIDFIDHNYDSAAKALEECAENGLAVAQYNLALLYLWGNGVRQNFEITHKWTMSANERGYVLATVLGGILLCAGHGVDRDYDAGLRQIHGAKGGSVTDAEQFIVRVLATDPVDHLRKAAGALLAAQRLVKRSASAANLSALATAQAEASQFDDAVLTQWRVVRLLRSARATKDEDKAMAKERLELYMSEKKFRSKQSAFGLRWALEG